MARKTTKTENIVVRVDKPTRDAFYRKASRHGTPSEILREFVSAFIEGRLTIQPPQQKENPLYVPRSQD